MVAACTFSIWTTLGVLVLHPEIFIGSGFARLRNSTWIYILVVNVEHDILGLQRLDCKRSKANFELVVLVDWREGGSDLPAISLHQVSYNRAALYRK